MSPFCGRSCLLKGADCCTVSHIEHEGEGLFRLACEHDIEGIVAKHKYAPYLPQQQTTWCKIRNRNYTRWDGRDELFERERGGDPDVRFWESCAMACADAQLAII